MRHPALLAYDRAIQSESEARLTPESRRASNARRFPHLFTVPPEYTASVQEAFSGKRDERTAS